MKDDPEGWYCPSCDHYLGEEGNAALTCEVCGNAGLEYREQDMIGCNHD